MSKAACLADSLVKMDQYEFRMKFPDIPSSGTLLFDGRVDPRPRQFSWPTLVHHSGDLECYWNEPFDYDTFTTSDEDTSDRQNASKRGMAVLEETSTTKTKVEIIYEVVKCMQAVDGPASTSSTDSMKILYYRLDKLSVEFWI